eukprot:11676186-Alexandrium_andersonii.AAC.1
MVRPCDVAEFIGGPTKQFDTSISAVWLWLANAKQGDLQYFRNKGFAIYHANICAGGSFYTPPGWCACTRAPQSLAACGVAKAVLP